MEASGKRGDYCPVTASYADSPDGPWTPYTGPVSVPIKTKLQGKYYSADTNYYRDSYTRSGYYYPVVNEQSAYNRFRNAELDVISSFPSGELETVRQ